MLRFNFYGVVLSALLILTIPASCAENQKSKSPKVPASLEDAKTAEEASEYVEHVFSELRKKIKTEDDEKQFIREYPPIGIAAADKIIALAKNDEMLERGYGIKLFAFDLSLREKPENEEKIKALVDEITQTGKFPELLISQRFSAFYRNARKLDRENLSQEKFEQIKEEAKSLFLVEQNSHSEFGPLTNILDFANQFETEQNQPHFLDATLKELVQFVLSEPAVKRYGEDKARDDGRATRVQKLQGYCRRMVGSPFELKGKTTDGDDFSWDAYKDKFVLIDFTASWCGPCRAEMPNLLDVYAEYHDKGFEIISIGISDKTENLKKQIEEDKITWTMISEELSPKIEGSTLGDYYGVIGIPTIFLVGKDGKIITSELRGAKLYSTVSQLFEEE